MTRPPAKPQKTRPSPLDRLGFLAARTLSHLPAGVQRALAGGHAVRRDGYTLDPALQLILASDPRMKRPWPEDALRLRRQQNRTIVGVRGPLPAVRSVRDMMVDGANGALHARLYTSDATFTNGAPPPLLVYFHGGGFVFGDLETHDVGCRLLCAHGGFHVLAVEYRLVPEHRFPAAIEDGQAAFAWAVRHAAGLGADPTRVGVGGDSAGANVSAVVSLLARGTKPAPACQVLIYPPDRPHARAPVA